MLKGNPLDQRVMPESVQPPMMALIDALRFRSITHTAAEGKLINKIAGDEVTCVEIGTARD